ncbi:MULTISPECIES: carbonic anhydrase [unclassified Streptomyces]|uniref:carbonic anhydrase n=1 Tax=unclassified Streptomyces TaxID=2593676 RepID=UPI000DC779FF|nr:MULTISPECIES: carbonic anhydrase [unclassified Streptomyces]AWZ09897.1 carbonic anhydrase [Streptomyces sp. ICC4]AWZ17550.1 carbonic anhydrase [Streptomyces sp. ICC1]
MHDLTEGVARFQQDVFPAKAELFARLATTHRPTTLFISCSDARVVPELITQREPGELFVIRTAGNLVPAHVPAHTPGSDGVAAGIEYAVAVLGVNDIVVCGHSACGAMTALADGHDLTALPAVAGWLRHAGTAQPRTATATATAAGSGDGVAALVRDNVAAQLANLATHPSVARALAGGSLTLHGWVYDIPTGSVGEIAPAAGRTAALAA